MSFSRSSEKSTTATRSRKTPSQSASSPRTASKTLTYSDSVSRRTFSNEHSRSVSRSGGTRSRTSEPSASFSASATSRTPPPTRSPTLSKSRSISLTDSAPRSTSKSRSLSSSRSSEKSPSNTLSRGRTRTRITRSKRYSHTRSTLTISRSQSKSITVEPSRSGSQSVTRTLTRRTPTNEKSFTWSHSRSAVRSGSFTSSRSWSRLSQSRSFSHRTPTPVKSITYSESKGATRSNSESFPRSTSRTQSPSQSDSASRSVRTPTLSDSLPRSRSNSPSRGTLTDSITRPKTRTKSQERSQSRSWSKSSTSKLTATNSPSLTETLTVSPPPTFTPPATPTKATSTDTPTQTVTRSFERTHSRTAGSLSSTRSSQRSGSRSSSETVTVSRGTPSRSPSVSLSRGTQTKSVSRERSATKSFTQEKSTSWSPSGRTPTQERTATRSRSLTGRSKTVPTPSRSHSHATRTLSYPHTMTKTSSQEQSATRTIKTPTGSRMHWSNTTTPSFTQEMTATVSGYRYSPSNSSSLSQTASRRRTRTASRDRTASFSVSHSVSSVRSASSSPSRSPSLSRATVTVSGSWQSSRSKTFSSETTPTTSLSITITSVTHELPITLSPTVDRTASESNERTRSETVTVSRTRTPPPTPTRSRSRSFEQSMSKSTSVSRSPSRGTLSRSDTIRLTLSFTWSPSVMRTLSLTDSNELTPTASAATRSASRTPTKRTPTSARTRSLSLSPSVSDSHSKSLPVTASIEGTLSFTITPPRTRTRSGTVARTLSFTRTPPPTRTRSRSLSAEGNTKTETVSATASLTHATLSTTASLNASMTSTVNATATATEAFVYVLFPVPTVLSGAVSTSSPSVRSSSGRRELLQLTPTGVGLSLPVLYANSFRLGLPASERRLVVAVSGDGFAIHGEHGTSIFNCINFNTNAAPTFRNVLGVVWTSPALQANLSAIAINFGVAPSFRLPTGTAEVVTLTFSSRCFLSGLTPVGNEVSFAISAGGSVTDPPTPLANSPVASGTTQGASIAAVAAGVGGASPGAALALGRLSVLTTLGACIRDDGDLTFMEHPTSVSWDALAGMSPVPDSDDVRHTAAIFLGAVTMDTVLSAALVVVRLAFVWHAMRGRRQATSAFGQFTEALASAGFPGRCIMLLIFVGTIVKCSVYLMFRMRAAVPLFIAVLMLFLWICVVAGFLFVLLGPSFTAHYVKRRFSDDIDTAFAEKESPAYAGERSSRAQDLGLDEDFESLGPSSPEAKERDAWQHRLGGVEDGPTPARQLGLSPASAERLGRTNAPGYTPRSASKRLQAAHDKAVAANTAAAQQRDDGESSEDEDKVVQRSLFNSLFKAHGVWRNGQLVDVADGTLHKARFVQRYGQLFHHFHGDARYWLIVEAFMNIAEGGLEAYALLTADCLSGAIVLMVLSVLYLLGLVVKRPYRVTFDNIFFVGIAVAQIVLISLLIANLSGSNNRDDYDTLVNLATAVRMAILIKAAIDVGVQLFSYIRRRIRRADRAKQARAASLASKSNHVHFTHLDDVEMSELTPSRPPPAALLQVPERTPYDPRPLPDLPPELLDDVRSPRLDPDLAPWAQPHQGMMMLPPEPPQHHRMMAAFPPSPRGSALHVRRGMTTPPTPSMHQRPPADLYLASSPDIHTHPAARGGGGFMDRMMQRPPSPRSPSQRTYHQQQQPYYPQEEQWNSPSSPPRDAFAGAPTQPDGWSAQPDPSGGSGGGGQVPTFRLSDSGELQSRHQAAAEAEQQRRFWSTPQGANLAQSIAQAGRTAAGASAMLEASTLFDAPAPRIHDLVVLPGDDLRPPQATRASAVPFDDDLL